MEVYRIVKEQYSSTLYASGYPNRWNVRDQKVIYTAGSRSLACLENVVHSSGETLLEQFIIMVIYIPDELLMTAVQPNQLPEDWFKKVRHPGCQQRGSDWYQAKKSAILKVPSAIIHQEWNYVLHTDHLDFDQITVVDRRFFSFDPRIKENQVE